MRLGGLCMPSPRAVEAIFQSNPSQPSVRVAVRNVLTELSVTGEHESASAEESNVEQRYFRITRANIRGAESQL